MAHITAMRGKLLGVNTADASWIAADRDTQTSGGRRLRGSAAPWIVTFISAASITFLLLYTCSVRRIFASGTHTASTQTTEVHCPFPTADVTPPTTNELKAWFATNAEHFREPQRITFRHLYFARVSNGGRSRDIAAKVLRQVSVEADSPAANLADPFMFSHYYRNRTKEQVARIFGTTFAQLLFEQRAGSWRGPIESDFGWHLVWIDAIKPGRLPRFEEIKPTIQAQWIAEQRNAIPEPATE